MSATTRGWRGRLRAGVSAALVAQLLAAPASAERMDVEAVPVPDGASELDRNSDIQMITYRSGLEPSAIQEFYDAALGKLGWTYDEEDSFLIEGVGSLTYANGDDAFRIAIQDGRPDSRTRMIVMGEGVKWAASSWDTSDGEEEPEAVETGPLAAHADYEVPVPEDCESIGQSETPFRTAVEATIRRPLADVAEFYRRELPARGWTQTVREEEAADGEKLVLEVDGERGPLTLELRKKRKDTVIEVATRDTDAARVAGVLPDPGQSRLLLGNMHDADAVIVIDGDERPVAAGTGAADPSAALSLPLAPGAHQVTIKLSGEGDQTESLQLGADETWAVMVVPTGGYFADRVY